MATATDEEQGTERHLKSVDGAVDAADDGDDGLVDEADHEGQTIEEIAEARAQSGADEAEQEAEPEKPTPPMQLALPGTKDTLNLTAGGQRPTASEIRFMGGKQPIEGAFEKGEVIECIVRVRIGEVAFVDSHDEYGNVKDTKRVHKGRLIGVVRQQTNA